MIKSEETMKKLTPKELAIVKNFPIGHVRELLDHIDALESELVTAEAYLKSIRDTAGSIHVAQEYATHGLKALGREEELRTK